MPSERNKCMLLTLSHIQKDDSLVPLLPYAIGCFLASILLTISGIAETHPQSLSLATYLIQFGWLLLQIQGTELVQKFGSHDQSLTLFYVWLLSMHVLDIHRRCAGIFAAGCHGDANSQRSHLSMDIGAMLVPGQQPSIAQYQTTDSTLKTVGYYYMGLLCRAVPTICQLSSNTMEQMAASEVVAGGGCMGKVSSTAPPTQKTGLTAPEGIPGMQEMEELILFEVVAGLGVCGIMLVTWLVMSIRQGGNRSVTMRQMSTRWRLAIKAIKGHGHDLRVLAEAKAEAFVEGLKFRIE